MRIFTSLLFVIFIFPRCQNVNNKAEVQETDFLKQNKKEEAFGAKNHECPSIESLFNSLGYLRDVQKTSEIITRNATLECFIKRYSTEFESLKQEEIISLKTQKDSLDSKLLVKRMKFQNSETTKVIFNAYSKGYYENCLGVKEPHFLLVAEKDIFIFYVEAERNRTLLNELQAQVNFFLIHCNKYNLMTLD